MTDPIRAKFTRDIEPWLDRLYQAAFRLTQGRADAEELLQDTCIRAFSKRESFAASGSPLGWLMRVQYNLFIDETRKRKRAAVVSIGEIGDPESMAGDEFDPEAAASAAQSFALIHDAWRKLKRSHRALIALRVEGYTLPEMQEITGLSVEVLNSRLQRARQSLARHLTTDTSAANAPRHMETRR